MAVEKVWKCDLSGDPVNAAYLRRVAVRTIADRPDAADWVDIGPCCHEKPISDLIVFAAEERRVTENGE